jgi:hypothetical protein
MVAGSFHLWGHLHGTSSVPSKWLRRIEWRIWQFASRYAKFSARAVHGLQRYLWRNGLLIPNSAARRRPGTLTQRFQGTGNPVSFQGQLETLGGTGDLADSSRTRCR